MANTVGSVSAKFMMDISNFKQGLAEAVAGLNSLKSKVSSTAKSMSESAKKIGTDYKQLGTNLQKVGAGISLTVGAPLALLGKQLIQNASDAEEFESKFKTVFGELAGETRAWVDSTAKDINRSKIDLMKYTGDVQNLLVGMGASRKEGAQMSKDAVMLAYDLASFNNLDDDLAQHNMVSALMGESEAAKTLGAIIGEESGNLEKAMAQMGIGGGGKVDTEGIKQIQAEIYKLQKALTSTKDFDQKATIKGEIEKLTATMNTLKKAGTGVKFQDLDQLTKMQVRYTAILMQSKDAIGDTKRTHESYANTLKGFQSVVKDLGLVFKDTLLPALVPILAKLKEGIEWFGKLSPAMQKVVLTIGAILIVAGPLLIFIGSLINSIYAIGVALEFASANPVVLIIAAIVAVIAILVLLIANSDKVKEVLINTFTAIGKAIASVVNGIINFFKNSFKNLQAFLGRFGLSITDLLLGPFWIIQKFVLKFWTWLFGKFNDMRKAVWNWAKNLVKGFWDSFKAPFVAVYDFIMDKIKKLIHIIKNPFQSIKDLINGNEISYDIQAKQTLSANTGKGGVTIQNLNVESKLGDPIDNEKASRDMMARFTRQATNESPLYANTI